MSGRAWLLMAVTDRQHGGNDGYDDDPDSSYTWDDTVPNRDGPDVGDVVVLWDKELSLGMSVIETLDHGEALKPVHRCPSCHRTSIKARKSASPVYRCYKCKHEFDDPDTELRHVRTYTAGYAAGWTGLDGDLTGDELRPVALYPGSQHALRELDWSAFSALLARVRPDLPLGALLSATDRIAGGHVQVTVRARVGQGRFRRRLLEKFGPVCALTGPAPREVLEAAHLYSYAATGRHEAGGGFLLRRDVHALFDAGLVTVGEDDRVVVAPTLTGHPVYGAMAGRGLTVGVTGTERAWLALHREQAAAVAGSVRDAGSGAG